MSPSSFCSFARFLFAGAAVCLHLHIRLHGGNQSRQRLKARYIAVRFGAGGLLLIAISIWVSAMGKLSPSLRDQIYPKIGVFILLESSFNLMLGLVLRQTARRLGDNNYS